MTNEILTDEEELLKMLFSGKIKIIETVLVQLRHLSKRYYSLLYEIIFPNIPELLVAERLNEKILSLASQYFLSKNELDLIAEFIQSLKPMTGYKLQSIRYLYKYPFNGIVIYSGDLNSFFSINKHIKLSDDLLLKINDKAEVFSGVTGIISKFSDVIEITTETNFKPYDTNYYVKQLKSLKEMPKEMIIEALTESIDEWIDIIENYYNDFKPLSRKDEIELYYILSIYDFWVEKATGDFDPALAEAGYYNNCGDKNNEK